MNIERFIKTSLQKILDDDELKWLTILDVLHRNIDILIDRSEYWFGNDIPEEYRQVVRSLISVSTTLIDSKNDYETIFKNEQYSDVRVYELISASLDKYTNFVEEDVDIVVHELKKSIVRTAPRTFIKSVVSVFLAFSLFWKSDTKCTIDIDDGPSNVIIKFFFANLSEIFPGIDEIQKVLFHYSADDEIKIGLGIHSALYNLRDIGAIVKIDSHHGKNTCLLQLLFPSLTFLSTIDAIRESNKLTQPDHVHKGEVIVVVKDLVLEVILREMLFENGYTITIFGIHDFEDCKNCHEYKAVIIDYDYIVQHFISMAIFNAYLMMGIITFQKVFIIYDEHVQREIKEIHNSHITFFKKPIVVENIISSIEKEG